MAIRANPKLIDELEPYGAEDVVKCYHCGNCSAVCPFSKAPYVFPRRPMRYLQMGLEEKLKGDLDPWLCYYCGECSDQCPREAEPGETMMSLRRWLTSRYDWTGISRLFYKSWRYEVGAIVVVAILTIIGFLAFGFSQGEPRHYDGPNAFLPSSSIHIFDWALAFVLLAFLLEQRGPHVVVHDGSRQDAARVSGARTCRGVYLLPSCTSSRRSATASASARARGSSTWR